MIKKILTIVGIATVISSYLLAGFLLSTLVDSAYSQDAPLPMNAPTIQTKSIHINTADERSEIIIKDIWKQPELSNVKIGKGASLGRIRASSENGTLIYPLGWQAFISQQVVGSWNGSYEAVAYGGF